MFLTINRIPFAKQEIGATVNFFIKIPSSVVNQCEKISLQFVVIIPLREHLNIAHRIAVCNAHTLPQLFLNHVSVHRRNRMKEEWTFPFKST